jgi:hypothetical protein
MTIRKTTPRNLCVYMAFRKITRAEFRDISRTPSMDLTIRHRFSRYRYLTPAPMSNRLKSR